MKTTKLERCTYRFIALGRLGFTVVGAHSAIKM
jgi:hypothetical protein